MGSGESVEEYDSEERKMREEEKKSNLGSAENV